MDEYGEVLSCLEPWMKNALCGVLHGKKAVQEIRLRLGHPLFIRYAGGGCFAGEQKIKPDEIARCLQRACGYSMQSAAESLAHGYVTLRGGHRVGVAGSVLAEGGKVLSLREAGSLNFRIAREIPGAAGDLPERLYSSGIPSVLIAGPPCSGKTTILRDLVRRLSEKGLQIAAVDERGELGGGCDLREAGLNIGPCTDLLSGYPKGAGMEIALRTLSPQLIVCDEIGSKPETDAALESLNAGVPLLAAAHGESLRQLAVRPALRPLFREKVFEYAVLLQKEPPGKVAEIIRIGENKA